MADETVEQIRAEWGAATRGPWDWVGNLPAKQIMLMAVRGWGEVVMDFNRWGFGGAQPAFVIDGLIYNAFQGKGGQSMMQIPKAHHPWEVRGIDHPDARFLAHSWEHVATLLAEVDRLRAFEAAARGLYDAYRRECVVCHGEDRADWPERMTEAHGRRQDAEDALFRLIHPDYDPEAWIPPALPGATPTADGDG